MRSPARILLILVILAIAGAAVYFWLGHRKESLIAENTPDALIFIDNPSAKQLIVCVGRDSLEVPPMSTVQYPVSSAKTAGVPLHICSLDAATRKVIADTTCVLAENSAEFFINATKSRYVYWDIVYENVMLQENTYDGFNVVHEMPPFLGFDSLVRVGNLVADVSLKFTTAFIVPIKDLQTAFNTNVESSIESEVPAGSITRHYLLSETDFIRNYMNTNHIRESEAAKRCLVYLIDQVYNRHIAAHPELKAKSSEFMRSPTGYFYIASDLQDIFDDFSRVEVFRKDTAFDDVKNMMNVVRQSELNDSIAARLFPVYPHTSVTYMITWTGFIDPQMKLERYESSN